MSQIGKLETVPLRELWKHEERGFSAWLADNLDALSEALTITLQTRAIGNRTQRQRIKALVRTCV